MSILLLEFCVWNENRRDRKTPKTTDFEMGFFFLRFFARRKGKHKGHDVTIKSNFRNKKRLQNVGTVHCFYVFFLRKEEKFFDLAKSLASFS